MVKRAISITTILLIIFFVGIVYARADARVNQLDAGDNVYVTVGASQDLVTTSVQAECGEQSATNYRPNLKEMPDGCFNVRVQNVSALADGAEMYVGRVVFTQSGGDGVGDLSQVVDLYRVAAADEPRALLDVHHQGYNFYLTNRHNRGDVVPHLKYSNLAAHSTRVSVPRHLGSVCLSLCSNDQQKVPVFKTVSVMNDSPLDEVLAAPLPYSFDVLSMKALQHMEVFKTDQSSREAVVNVNENFAEVNLAVG